MLNLCEFEKLAEACGNRYVAIQWLSRESRKLFEENKDYRILESKMLSWALTGECPYSETQLARRKFVNKLDNVDELLEYVTDEEVEQEVRTFYKASVKNRKLILCDRDDLGRSRLSRVNILLRMAWANFK